MTALIVAWLGLLASLGVVAYFQEKRAWNGGLCRKCWTRWRCYDTDSQGGRGYKCETGHGCWISWPVDRQRVGGER